MATIRQNQMVVWVQEDGPHTEFQPYAGMDGRMGMTGKNVPRPSINTNYEIDRDGTPRILNQTQQPPTGGPTNTLVVYERPFITYLEKVHQTDEEINVQERIVECGLLDNLHAWDKMRYWAGGKLTSFAPGDGPTLGGNTDNVQLTSAVEYEALLVLVRNSLSSLTSGTAEDITAIDGLAESEGGSCATSYPGADKILFAGHADGGLLYSRGGGGSWAAVTTAPFAALTPVVAVAVQPYDRDQGRIVVASATAIKTATFDYGDEGGMTWTTPTLPANTAITALGWGSGTWASRIYYAESGDIYVSLDRGATFETDPLYSGVNALAAFAFHPDGTVAYAAGAANTILKESNRSGGFSAGVGPSGGGAFTALAVAKNGTLFAGNGTSIYMSNNGAANTGGWTELNDFGANMAVVAIQLIKNFAQAIRVVVDDTTGGNGEVWESMDGGASWRQIGVVANTGYNDAYFSELDDNLAIIAGDGGAIHRMAP